MRVSSGSLILIMTSLLFYSPHIQLPYNIDYTYPQITGESLSASALEFNRLVTDMVNTSVQQFKNYVKADMLHMQTLPDSVKHNTFTMNYVVDVIKPANQILISVR